MDNKNRKLFVIKQSKGCKFVSKIRLAAGPAGRAYPQTLYSRNGGPHIRGRGPTSNRDGFEASRFKAKAMGLRGQGHGTSRPRPRPWVIIKVEAKDGREQSVVTMT